MDQMPLAPAQQPPGSDEGVVVVVGEEPVFQCSICMEEDSRENMIAACNCASTVHPACLERWINTRPFSATLDHHACEVCRSPYNIKVVSKIGRGRLCSGASWSQYITCCMLLLMFAMLAFVIVIYVHSEEYKSEENEDTEWLLWVLTAGTGLLFLSTMAKIYERWRDANLVERVDIREREGDAAQATPINGGDYQPPSPAVATAVASPSAEEASPVLQAQPAVAPMRGDYHSTSGVDGTLQATSV